MIFFKSDVSSLNLAQKLFSLESKQQRNLIQSIAHLKNVQLLNKFKRVEHFNRSIAQGNHLFEDRFRHFSTYSAILFHFDYISLPNKFCSDKRNFAYPLFFFEYKTMIFEIDENSFIPEEDFIGTAKEPEHQEAVLALLANKPQEFLQRLSNNSKGSFNLSAYRAVSDRLHLYEPDSRNEFDLHLTRKLADLILKSEDNGRFFETKEKQNLHKYVQQQFLEEKHKTKANQDLIKAYQYVFKRISHLDDLIFFSKFLNRVYARDPFEFVLTTCQNFMEDKEQIELLPLILQNINLYEKEEKLVIKFCLVRLMTCLGNRSKNVNTDKVIDEVKQAIRDNPYEKLTLALIQMDPYLFQQYTMGHRHPRELIQFDFEHNQIRLNCPNLHKEMRNGRIFESYFKKMKEMEQLVHKYQILSHSFKVEDNNLFLGLNYKLIKLGEDINFDYIERINNKTILQFIDFLNVLIRHQNLKFVVINQQQILDENYNLKYICKAFQNFVHLYKQRNGRTDVQAIEHTVTNWAKNISKWIGTGILKSENIIKSIIKSYFAIFAWNQGQEQFISLANFQSQISKSVFELMTLVDSFPCYEETFKGVKNIIFKWSLQLIPDTKEFKDIIRKMMDCYFNDELVLQNFLKEDIFETPAIFKVAKQNIIDCIMENINLRYKVIESQEGKGNQDKFVKAHLRFFPKIGYIISSRIIGNYSEHFSQVVMKFYLHFAHVWPILHSYRMWILQVCKDSIDIKIDEKIRELREMCKDFTKQLLIENDNGLTLDLQVKKETKQFYYQIYDSGNKIINWLRMKRNKNNLTSLCYFELIELMLDLTEINKKIQSKENISQNLEKCMDIAYTIRKGLNSLSTEFNQTLRSWICNSNRFLNIKEEESIMSEIGKLIIRIVSAEPVNNQFRWKFICDIMGLTETKIITTISSKQIMGPLQKYTAKLSHNLQDFIPFNMACSLYNELRNFYPQILRKLFSCLNEQSKDMWMILEKIILPPVVISGPCLFNGENQEKAKQQMAFGLYYDQFQKITKLLTESANMHEQIKILVKLEKEQKIFSKFYQILRTKNCKIVEVIRSNPRDLGLRGRPQMNRGEIISYLSQMGISQEESEIALESIDYPDPNLAMEWIDNNQQRLDQLLLNRTLERTRMENNRREMRREVQMPLDKSLPQLPFADFQSKIIQLSKIWIKIIFKQIFKEQNYSQSDILKNVLFLFLDSLKPDKAQKQYLNLYIKLCQDIEKLNEVQDISSQIGLLAIILQATFLKLDSAKKQQFYLKSINLKLLTYLPRVKNEESLKRVFSLLNSTLPIFKINEAISQQVQNYLGFLLDCILKYKISQKSISEIMLKIAKTGKQSLMRRIIRNLRVFLKEKLIKDSIFALMNMLLQSDKELSLVNAELDLKTFLYERYKHRFASFHPDKEHVLQIEIRQISTAFPKYDRGSAIYDVAKQMLSKKKNNNKLLFFDCRKEENQLDYSCFGKTKFISYSIKEHFKTMIKSILTILFQMDNRQEQDQIIQDIHKLLANFRILLPFTIHEQIGDQNLISWLLSSSNKSKKKYKLLTFLTLHCNLAIKKQHYNFLFLSEYVCSRIIEYTLREDKQLLWNSFTVLYLSQVRVFSQLSTANLSETNPISLLRFFQSKIRNADPISYLPISQFVYIQYKRKLLDNLKRKYKFTGNTHESTLERQFLNISPFFKSLELKKANKTDRSPLTIQEEQYDDEEGIQGIFLRESLRRPYPVNNLEQFIVPLPIPEPKPGEEKDKQLNNQNAKQQIRGPLVLGKKQFIENIIDQFNKYLEFEEENGNYFELDDIEPPIEPIVLPNLNSVGNRINLDNSYVNIEINFKKLSAFEERIASLYSIICPKGNWETKKQKNRSQLLINDNRITLSRRLLESLNLSNEPNRDTLLTLERLIQGRIRHAEEGINNPPVRSININDIFSSLTQFTNPILPEVSMDIENPVIIPEISHSQNEQDIPRQIMEPEPLQQNLIIDNIPIVSEQQYHPLPQQHLQNQAEEPEIQIETTIHPNNPSIQLEPAIEVEVDPRPVSNQVPNEAPQRQRQILTVFGLPQTYLRDVGLDQEFFDSLPEDLQQEQLMTFMAQQGTNPNRSGSGNIQSNEPQDLQSQNIAFLESLDPQTRAQVLVEATPEFLISLPVNIREEAERHRSAQLNRIIQEQQIEQERNYINRQRNKAPLVYPKVDKQEFSPIPEQTARSIFRGILNIYPKLKLSALKILLQNKTTQEKTIASIIALIRSMQAKSNHSRRHPLNRVEIVQKQIRINSFENWTNEDVNEVRTTLLHLILEHLKTPLYKDDQFLTENITPDVYLEETLPFLQAKQNIDPLVELSYLSLNHYPELAIEVIKKAKNLPDQLLEKIVEGIKNNRWPNEFYESLSNFSSNLRLKQIFCREFEDKPPKIEILGKLLKYQFSRLPQLKNIHRDALQYYSSSHHEFLNQIFSIYTTEDLNQIEDLLVKHKHIHFEVIKHLYSMGRELEKQPIGIILKKPHLLDFQTKKFIFRNHPKLRRQSGRRVHIEVDRSHLFQGSYNQLMGRTVKELEGRIQVSFINEPGYDAGGLKREWFLLVSREIFNQDYCLFEKSSSGSTYQPNPRSYVNPDHLNYFKFIGRFIGKALVDRQLIDAYFTRAFYKMIIGQELEFKDLQQQDYEFFKSMEWLKNNKIDENTFTFSYIYDNFGNKVEKELVPDGKNIVVTEQNKLEYIEKYSMAKMRDDFSKQISKFLEGFYQVVPQECISFFQAKQLELLISGVPEVDVEDLKRNTDYSGYNPTDQIIIWFWEVVSEYSQEDLAKLVQFITGTSKIPVEGFSHMIGMNGVQRISIHKDPCGHQLPKSHTCFNQLDLPNYPSKEILRQKLSICLAWGSEGFGFM